MMLTGRCVCFILCFNLAWAIGCSSPEPEQAIIRTVNRDDKDLRSTWVYRSSMGEESEHPARVRMDISVSGNRFHIVAQWTAADPLRRHETEEWVHDGRMLWQSLPHQKQMNRFEARTFKSIPFWKMPNQMTPLGPPKEVGEETVAGRTCTVLEMRGRYDQGDVTLRYSIDKEKSVLLKKEHLLKAGGIPLVHETYECERIQFDPGLRKGVFDVSVPADWVEVKKHYLDSQLLNTKF